MIRLLYIFRGLVPPGPDPNQDRFTYLSEIAEGDILLPVWWRSAAEAAPHLRPGFPEYRVGRFRYHLHTAYRWPPPLRPLACLIFFIRSGLRLHRQQPFDVIVAYGTNTTGIGAVMLKWFTGAKLIVEIPGVPENAFRYDQPNAGFRATIKRFIANRLLDAVGGRADCIKLLYPSQLARHRRLRSRPCAVFHDFVPVTSIVPSPAEGAFVLSVGFPWYTKGMDIVIRAFKAIAPGFPDARLKLMGFFPDRRYLDHLAAGCPQIEFVAAGPNRDALALIRTCAVYVLASRTESMGRVLLEAMAAGKPIIASSVGGVPTYVTHGENGLLFQSENADQLAAALQLLLADRALRDRLGASGRERVQREFDERAYIRAFGAMLAAVTDAKPAAPGSGGPGAHAAQDAPAAQAGSPWSNQ